MSTPEECCTLVLLQYSKLDALGDVARSLLIHLSLNRELEDSDGAGVVGQQPRILAHEKRQVGGGLRTIEEISADIRAATYASDPDLLDRCAVELDELGGAEAAADAHSARGTAANLRGYAALAVEHFQAAIVAYEQINNARGLAVVVGNLGNSYLSMGDVQAALEYLRQGLELHQELGNHLDVAFLMNSIGNALRNTGDFVGALEHYNRALKSHQELANLGGIALVTSNIGIVHRVTGNLPDALEHNIRALEIHKELGDGWGTARVLNNMALVHSNLGDEASAITCLHEALALHEEHSNTRGIAIVTGNLGLAFESKGDYAKAIEYFTHSLALHKEVNNRASVVLVLGNLINTALALKNLDHARELLQQMDELEITDPDSKIRRAMLHAILLDLEDDHRTATEIFKNVLPEAASHGLRMREAEIHQWLRDLALKHNDLASYVEHNNEYTRITEEVTGKEAALKVAMQAKQREIDVERKENEQKLSVLYSTLPKAVADRVANGETVNDSHDHAAVLFLDIVGFTSHSSSMDAQETITLLASLYKEFDQISDRCGVVKIKTIGDSYMAVAFERDDDLSEQPAVTEGLSDQGIEGTAAARRAAECALSMMQTTFTWPDGSPLQFRIGIHAGPVVAGVIGTQRLQYDVWGDTVNVASRMESTGEPGRIQVSEVFASALCLVPCASDEHNRALGTRHPALRERGTIAIKGKGTMKTYWLEGA